MLPFSPLHKKYLTCLGIVIISLLVSVVCWHAFWGLLRVIDWLVDTGFRAVPDVPLLDRAAVLVGLCLLLPLVFLALCLEMLIVLAPAFALISSLCTLLDVWNRPKSPRPTPAQQSLYHAMRAKGWSELAAQQAASRLRP